MDFYHSLITEQSWKELQALRQRVQFILIGGWAVYLYTKGLKSKDIDIIVDYDQLPIFQQRYRFSKNDRLKKYEARRGPVEIDIYLPHFSSLGVPVENLLGKTRQQEGFTVLEPAHLLVLKLYTLKDRGRSPKGEKDFLDCVSLFQLPSVESEEIRGLVAGYGLKGVWENWLEHLREHRDLPALGLNAHQFSRLRKKWFEH